MAKRVINCDSWLDALGDQVSELFWKGVILAALGGVGIAAIGGAIEQESPSTADSYEQVQPAKPQPKQPALPNQQWSSGIPAGMAEFYSTQSGTTEVFGVNLSDRTNANGDVVYDANWSDGYKSSYVFWRNGKVEIFSKDGNGKMTNMPGTFIADGNGGIVITAKSGSRTTFPNLVPSMN
tara:strand:- start:429 stop:968 length:540 start_codon:yes stop_codon:yes gene_type:complete